MSHTKTAIVTGGGGEIGSAISRAFLEEGYSVVVAQRRKTKLTDVHWIQTDLSDEIQCQALIEQVVRDFGALTALINNAGIMNESVLEHTSLHQWEQTLKINLTAPFLLTKLALPHLRKNKGCIVNIGSIEGIACNPTHGAYSVSKAALHALTRATAVDHGSEVRCNCIAPGWIDTSLNTQFVDAMPNPKKFREQIGSIHPVGRTGLPIDIAKLAVFLCSEGAAFVSGQTFRVDGGRTVQLPLPTT